MSIVSAISARDSRVVRGSWSAIGDMVAQAATPWADHRVVSPPSPPAVDRRLAGDSYSDSAPRHAAIVAHEDRAPDGAEVHPSVLVHERRLCHPRGLDLVDAVVDLVPGPTGIRRPPDAERTAATAQS